MVQPTILARAIIPIPMGPQPTMTIVSPARTSARRRAWAPMARGSTMAISSGLSPPAGISTSVGRAMISCIPPSVWTPRTRMRTQQFVLPLRQAMHSPQLR